MMLRSSLLSTFLALAAAFAHFSCDSGGIGGSGATSVSEGPVEAYGSIVVNGVVWNIDDAEIEIDGQPASEYDIELGMIVRVYGDLDPDGQSGTASFVVHDPALEGPVTEVQDLGPLRALTVLGHTVFVDAGKTSFAEGEPGYGFDDTAVGDLVSISGLRDAVGVLHATRLARYGLAMPGSSPVSVDGTVEDFDGFESFLVGNTPVGFDAATLLENLPWGLLNGLPIEVRGVLTGPSGVLANQIRLRLPGFSGDFEDAAVKGFVTDWSGIGHFDVAGQRVDGSDAVFLSGSEGDLANGSLAEIEGCLENGVLVAERITVDSD